MSSGTSCRCILILGLSLLLSNTYVTRSVHICNVWAEASVALETLKQVVNLVE